MMTSELATNYIPMLVLFPLWLIAGVFLVRFLLRSRQTIGRKIVLWMVGMVTMLGFAVLLLGGYAVISQRFRGALRLYSSTHTPVVMDDPMFNKPGSTWSSVLAGFELADVEGKRTMLLVHQEEKNVFVFAPGYYMFGKIVDGAFVPDLSTKERTSLWWLLTKDPYVSTGSVVEE